MNAATSADRSTPTFADLYDRVVGADFWPHWWQAFSRFRNTHDIPFTRSCDVACGTGETALRLARWGGRVYGTDLSPDMIRVAREKCRNTSAKLWVQPMQRLSLPEPVDLLVCAYDSLNTLASDAELGATLAGFRRALAPGGYAVVDVATIGHLAHDWGTGVRRVAVGELDTVWHTEWVPERQALTVHVTIRGVAPGGGTFRVQERVVEYGYPKAVLDAAIGAAGLAVVDVRDLIPWTPGAEDSSRLIYLLRRPVERE